MADFFQEYADINGIKEYILHYPAEGKPVLLFVHGGPGTSESVYGYKMKEMFQDKFTLVFYDQRGAGRTLRRNSKAKPTRDLLLNDLHDTIEYIKEKYGTKQVILMGHSWGTVLGSIYSIQHPENLSCYIGVGQVDDFNKNEKLAFRELEHRIRQSNSKRDIKTIQVYHDYPPESWDQNSLKVYNKISKLKDKYNLSTTVKVNLVKMARKSPIRFTNLDFIAMQRGEKLSEHLMLELLDEFRISRYGLEYKVPIYYLFGKNDYVTSSEACLETFRQIKAPKKEMIIIEDAGHAVMFEQGSAFAKAICSII